jgi:hypothetical protein
MPKDEPSRKGDNRRGQAGDLPEHGQEPKEK